jgi:signal transduction histidine kinase
MTVALGIAVLLATGGWMQARRTAGLLRERAACVAHEVRGPLSALRLALHGAGRRRELSPALLAALELELRRAALALDEPVPRRGAVGGDEVVDLVALLRCQEQTWRELAAARGARVSLLPGPRAALVRADALRVAQATSNLVVNAIEHGGGPIEIRASTIGDRVRVEVTDGGRGLRAPVSRLASGPRRGRRGRGRHGRGLAITVGVVAHYGGRVTALPSSRGGRVALELPAAPETR